MPLAARPAAACGHLSAACRLSTAIGSTAATLLLRPSRARRFASASCQNAGSSASGQPSATYESASAVVRWHSSQCSVGCAPAGSPSWTTRSASMQAAPAARRRSTLHRRKRGAAVSTARGYGRWHDMPQFQASLLTLCRRCCPLRNRTGLLQSAHFARLQRPRKQSL